MELTFVELFVGTGNISSSFREHGFKVWNTDNRNRRGKCTPDMVSDIVKVKRPLIPLDHINVVWASPPCTGFSYGAGDFYFKERKPKDTEDIKRLIKIAKYTLKLIPQMYPDLFFIENPRGHLRYYKEMIDFLAKQKGMVKPITISSYGGATTKPTDIFTNAYDWETRPMDAYGRGAKNTGIIKSLSSLTKSQQQTMPKELGDSIARYCYEKLTGTKFVPVIQNSQELIISETTQD